MPGGRIAGLPSIGIAGLVLLSPARLFAGRKEWRCASAGHGMCRTNSGCSGGVAANCGRSSCGLRSSLLARALLAGGLHLNFSGR
jgi:hypothetical protein